MNIQQLLTQFYRVIDKKNNVFKKTYSKYLFDKKSLTSLETSVKNCLLNTKDKVKSYNFSDFSIRITPPKLPRNCYNPNGIEEIEVTLHSEITYAKISKKKITDPIHSLLFIVSINSKNPKAFQSWHLDRDALDKETIASSNDYLHPRYHITFGGTAIKEQKAEGVDFGQTLYFGTPRFMHPPLDPILGIDFLLNHYVRREHAEIFIGNKEYSQIVKKMKDFLWKPYAFAFSQNYCRSITIDNEDISIDPSFTSSVIGDENI